MKVLLVSIIVGCFVVAAAACSDEPSPAVDGGACHPNGSPGPCNAGDMITCVYCVPDAGRVYGIQVCDADGGAYGPCEP